MTPLTTNPRVVLLVAANGTVITAATNVSNALVVETVTVTDPDAENTFNKLAAGLPFNYNPADVIPEPTYTPTN